MTKIHKTKLALLGATAFFAATSAHAQVADTWSIDGNVTVSSTNTSTDAVALNPVAGAALGIDSALISDGFKNSISSSAVGSSASSSFTSLNNSGSAGDAALVVGGTVTVASGNLAPVTNFSDVVATNNGPQIVAGSANSISLAAVGSSASVSGSSTLTDVAGNAVDGDTFSYTADSLVVSSGAISALGDDAAAETDPGTLVGGNDAAVTLTLATSLTTPNIQGGFGNSISVSGVGSSSSASFSAAVGGDGSNLETFEVSLGTVGISSANTDNGTVGVGLGADGITTPKIDGGNANSISAAAVGSSASFSLASGTYDSGLIGNFNASVDELNVDSTNNGAITLSADGADVAALTTVGGADGAAIAGAGNGNSISASAVGSSGSVSYANTIYSGENGTAAGEVTFAAITVNSTNLGAITNAADLTSAGGLVNIDGGSRNSISIAGVGASASQSISITDYSGSGTTTGVATSTGEILLNAANLGGVSVSGGLASPTIADGFSNSISSAAVGASASQSVSRTLLLTQ